jgi:TP901 family phage tail tape measure protein
VAFADTQKLTVQLDLKGNIKAAVGQVARDLKGLEKATTNTQRSLGKLSQNLQRGIAIGAAAAAGGFIAVAKAAGDFEAQMNTIATIVDRKDLKEIGDSLRKIARDTGISLDDLTTGYYDLASAGVKGKLATEALNDAVTLGIGGLATTAETVDLLTTAINAYQLDAAGAAKATDQFALAVADGKVKASEIAATFSDIAPVAKAYGVGIDQIAASYAFLTAQGVPAEEVTTEMQRAIVSLISPTAALTEAQKKLKISFTEEVRKKGLVPALQELRKYSDETGIPLIDLLGRIEAVKYTLQTTGPSFTGYTAELAKMGNASGTAAKQMAERQQGLNFQLARLKALAKDAGITIGNALLPKLTPLIEKLNTFIGKNQDKIADFGTKLAKGFEDFATALQKVDFKGIIGGLELTGRVARTIVDAFLALPPDIQKLAVAALAINKVGGGIITSGIKDILGFALNRLTTINAANVTVIGGNVTGGGGGLPAAAAAGGGALATAATATAVISVAAVAAAAKLIQDKIDLQGAGLVTQAGGFAPKATDTELANSIKGLETQLGSMAFNTFDSKNKIVATLNVLIAEQNKRAIETQQTVAAAAVHTTERNEALLTPVKRAIIAADAHELGAINRASAAQIRSARGDSHSERSAINRASLQQRAALARAAAASRATTEAIKDKDLSFTANLAVTTNVSLRETIKTRTTFRRLGGTLS